MKIKSRVLSFILVLTLLFSSFAFTVSASGVNAELDLGIDEDIELFEPTAYYDQALTEDDARNYFAKIKAPGTSASFSFRDLWGANGNNIEMHLVKGAQSENAEKGDDENYNEYVMLIPSENAANNHSINSSSHSYIDVTVGKEITYTGTSNDTRYLVLELDVATESDILPIFYQVTARHRAYSGSTFDQDFAFPGPYTPANNADSKYTNMTPGVFHHFTLIGDTYTNNLYAYLDNRLIEIRANSVIDNAKGYYNNYKNQVSTTKIYLQGFRIQMNNSVTNLNGNMSICYDNIKCYTLLNDDSKNGNLSSVLGGNLVNWNYSGYSKYDSETAVKLPNLIEIDGENYTNIPDAEVALNTYETGTVATLRRDVYSGNIEVNTDATIHTAGAHVSLTEGSDVDLIKADGSTWIATLTGNKYSATIKSTNASNVTSSLYFPHKDNLIYNINQTSAINAITESDPLSDAEWELAKKLGLDSIIGDDKLLSDTEINDALTAEQKKQFTKYAVDGIIFRSYDGIEYLVIQDSTNEIGDFAPNVHYQVNANTNYKNSQSEYLLGGHKYVVFDQDIYTESEFINVYNGFNLRTTDDKPLPTVNVFAEDLNVKPGEWHHITYIGEVETGNSYLFMDGVYVKKMIGGLYNAEGLSKNGGSYETMVLGSFRALQVAGENRTGQLLTPEMSAGADNFCLRWADDDSMISFIERVNNGDTTDLQEWSGCLYNDGHAEESIVIASIDGVRYYDTHSMTEALTADYSDTKVRNVVFYRDYVGTIKVNCRAIINTACLSNSKLIYSSACQTSVNGNIVTVEREINTTLIQANKQNTGSGIAFGTGNLYSGHDVAGEAWMVTDQGYSYLWDTGVAGNTHTLPISNGTLSSKVTHSTSSSNGSWGGAASVTVTSTKTQYYYTLEFDIAKKSETSAPKLTFNFSFGGTNKNYTVDLTSVISSLAVGDFAHVTVIGTVDVVSTISYSITSSGNWMSTKISASSVKNTANTYTVGSNVYVNDVKNNELSNNSVITFSDSSETGTAITWSNAALNVPVGSQVLLDNVNASIDSTTTTYTTKRQTTQSGTSAGTTLTSDFTNNNGTSDKLGGTGTANTLTDNAGVTNAYGSSDLSSNAGFGSDVTAGGAISDSYDLPSQDLLEYIADNAIAYIDGTPYTSWSDLSAAINAKYAQSNKTVEVTVVKRPDTVLNVTANVIFHTGGHFISTDNLVNVGSGCISRVNDTLNTIEIIVLGNTELLATFNGVDYTDEDTLRDVLTIARTAELEFYKIPSTPLEITCPAIVNTNGYDASVLYSTEEFEFQITIDGNIHTIVDETRIGKITVNLVANGKTVTNVYELPYGSDIANYLTQRGIKSNAFVTDSVVYTDITWSPEPTGRVEKSEYTFTANAGKSTPIEEGYHFYIDADGNQSTIATDSELIAKLSQNGNATLILNNDVDLSSLNNAMSGSGTKNVYLNGHTITTSKTGNHLFTLGGSGIFNFYGPGTIEATRETSTRSVFFAGYNFAGTLTLDNITINTSNVLATIRNGHVVIRHCDINAYTNNNVTALFSLAEDYTNPDTGDHDYTGNPTHSISPDISLVISESDVNFRYANVVDRYSNFTSDRPLINYKNVTSTNKTNDATSPEYLAFNCKDFIDSTIVYAQGSFVQADASDSNLADAYKHSNLKIYINESTVIAKSWYKGNIKPSSIIIYDDVRTNIDDITNLAFAMNLVRAKTSDSLSKVLYTSHNYATVVWSNTSGGTQEYWASGSVPSHPSYKFFSTDVVVKGQHLDFSDTLGGGSFPFKLLCNLTLSNSIGFNVYIPTANAIEAIFLNGVPMTQGTFDDGSIRVSSITSGGQEIQCYDYSVQLPPQEAGKEMTLLIKLSNGLQVSRTISVGEYASKLYTQNIKDKINSSDIEVKSEAIRVRDLLHVALSYIEQSTMYAGYNVDMSKISEVLALSGMNTCSYTDKNTYTNYSESFKAAFTGILKGVQLNVMDTSAIRFNLAAGVELQNVEFRVADDEGNLVTREATIGDGYVEISLRAYEMARDIEVTVNGVTATYNLYTYQMKLAEQIAIEQNGASGIVTGKQREYVAAQKLVDVMFKYAAVSDYYLNENKAEHTNPNA